MNSAPLPWPEVLKLQDFVDDCLRVNTHIKVLEAGCGSAQHLDMGSNVHFTGIDVSATQLDNPANSYMDEKINGDIQVYDFPAKKFDIVICWDVLEHLSSPEKALKRFSYCLKENGLLIIALPNVLSFEALITKFFPHIVHVYIHRYIFKNTNAGKEGYPPFPTYMRFSVSPDAIQKNASSFGLAISYWAKYDRGRGQQLSLSNPIIYRFYWLASNFVKIITFGKVDAKKSSFVAVLTKT